MVIHNLKELRSLNRDLKQQDEICFAIEKEEKILYRIEDSFLNCLSHDNGIVFRLLKIQEKEKKKLAERCYGYKHHFHGSGVYWPYFKVGDYKAAKRLIEQIYILIEGEHSQEDSTEDSTEDRINSRYEILDI